MRDVVSAWSAVRQELLVRICPSCKTAMKFPVGSQQVAMRNISARCKVQRKECTMRRAPRADPTCSPAAENEQHG
jgi:hypothetical protein